MTHDGMPYSVAILLAKRRRLSAGQSNVKSETSAKMPQQRLYKSKRVTIFVDEDIDKIRDFIAQQTGVQMSYVQVFDHLIHFYVQHAAEPRTKWAPVFKQEKKDAL